jgi:hypothetical protein
MNASHLHAADREQTHAARRTDLHLLDPSAAATDSISLHSVGHLSFDMAISSTNTAYSTPRSLSDPRSDLISADAQSVMATVASTTL